MKSILLYFDGLPASYRALQLAEDLVKVLGGRIVFLYVRTRHLESAPFHPLQGPPTMTEADRPILSVPEHSREEEMRHWLSIMEKGREQLDAKGIRADYLIAEGQVFDEVLKEASKGYDLLICPIALKSDESTLSAGALHKIAARLPCSILVVR